MVQTSDFGLSKTKMNYFSTEFFSVCHMNTFIR